MEKTKLYYDFENTRIAKIYCDRFVRTARILNIGCHIVTVLLGIEKVHARFEISGNPQDVEIFINFVEEALNLESQQTLNQ